MTNTATYQDLLAEVSEFWNPLPDKPEETPHSLLNALWHTASGVRLSAELAKTMNTLPSLDNETRKRLRTLLELRKGGVPLAHLTERQHFLGLELLAGPHALVPRKETEILGRAVLVKLQSLTVERGQLMVMDLCTGSGNLALAYANCEPAAAVYGADICGKAIALARRNAVHLGLHEHIDFIQGDMFAPFENGTIGKWDIISCNPPYVSKAKVPLMHHEISRFEPELAFNGGPLGISVLARLLRNAPRFLKPSSWLGFEVGLGQGDFFVKNLQNNPAFCEIEPQTDAAGNIRAILARSQPDASVF